MSIFREFGGKSSYYTESELDRLQNPEKYNYDQAQYDAFSAQAQKKADARQAAAELAQDAIPFSYVGRGTGSTNPAFSFAGYSGQTSGGTSGLSGFGGTAGTQFKREGGVINQPMPMNRVPGPVRPSGAPQVPTQPQPIGTPFADPIRTSQNKPQLGSTGVGGLFEAQYSVGMDETTNTMGGQLGPTEIGSIELGSTEIGSIGGQQAAQHRMLLGQQLKMDGGPLSSYQNYLMQTYGAPALNVADQMVRDDVNYFVDLVNQAEEAHFGKPQQQLVEQGIATLQ